MPVVCHLEGSWFSRYHTIVLPYGVFHCFDIVKTLTAKVLSLLKTQGNSTSKKHRQLANVKINACQIHED